MHTLFVSIANNTHLALNWRSYALYMIVHNYIYIYIYKSVGGHHLLPVRVCLSTFNNFINIFINIMLLNLYLTVRSKVAPSTLHVPWHRHAFGPNSWLNRHWYHFPGMYIVLLSLGLFWMTVFTTFDISGEHPWRILRHKDVPGFIDGCPSDVWRRGVSLWPLDGKHTFIYKQWACFCHTKLEISSVIVFNAFHIHSFIGQTTF